MKTDGRKAQHEDGVYLDMPHADYLAQERLSFSGLWKINQSPQAFWADSWFNPEREPQPVTDWQLIGTAYHCARLEPERFEAEYACDLDPDEFPDALRTQGEIQEALAALGEPKKKSGERVMDQAYRLREADPDADIWPVLVEQHRDRHAGKELLSPKVYREIVRDVARLRAAPEIAKLLTGGHAEVSILWTDDIGLPMKARLDYLTPTHWLDFKTFDNSRERPIEECLRAAFRWRGYWMQAGVYSDAATAAQAMRPDLFGADDLACWYVWQQKGGVPGLYARQIEMRRMHESLEAAAPDDEAAAEARTKYGGPSALMQLARAHIDAAKRQFVAMQEVYPPGQPWMPVLDQVRRWGDDQWPEKWLGGEWS